MKLFGIGASSGVAIAKVLKLTAQTPQISDQKVDDVQAEINGFKQAIDKTITEVNNIKTIAQQNLGVEQANVFDAHIQIISDPVFQNEIIAFITEKNINNIFATSTIAKKYINLFEQMDNQYMRERASDIKDVTHRLINNLAGISTIDLTNLREQVIIIGHDITPSETAQMNKQFVLGFGAEVGGKTSHAAIMARSLEIPAVLGLKDITNHVQDGDEIAIDGDAGMIIINPSNHEKEPLQTKINQFQSDKIALEKYRNLPSLTQDGTKVELAANIGSLNDIQSVIDNDGEAIGLFRSEFLYMDKNDWPSEDEQFNAYKTVLEKMNNKLVVIRTLDIGGDKTLNYFKFPREDNPFLGYRAIRFSLDEKDKFKVQLRALIRASIYGNLAIMFPMIATIEEFIQAKNIYNEVYQKLKSQNIEVNNKIQVGMMMEIPSAALLAHQFAKHADFFSIGTNDLMQYTMAHDRMNEKVSYLYQPLSPAILSLISLIIKGAHQEGKWVGMCGEMASDSSVIPFLIGLGLNELSMTPSAILKARRQIASINTKSAQKLVVQALTLSTSDEVKQLLTKFNQAK